MEQSTPGGSNKGFSSRFCVDSRVRHETPIEIRRDYNQKDEVNSPNILSNNNYLRNFISEI